ncbi:LAETG motif-containing sortase-dependent surface protein [Streptomyces coeruleoprunus]
MTTSPSNTVVPSPSASEPAEVCEDFKDNEGVYTELRGLPSKVVAGSGWKNFTFRVTNKTNKTFDSVEAYIMAEAVDGKDFEDISQFITLQVQLEEDGPWQSIDDVEGYFGTTGSLQPKKFAEAQMRLKVDAKAPAGYGAAFTLGVHISKDSVCEYGEMNTYEFEILAAGSKPGDVDDSKGKPGKPSGNKPAPTGQLSQLPVTGSLANTGSNSMLPTIGIAGGIAIVAGAGVVFALKRRSNGAAA